eukprot:10541997-Karenia_brevis.AAC.1
MVMMICYEFISANMAKMESRWAKIRPICSIGHIWANMGAKSPQKTALRKLRRWGAARSAGEGGWIPIINQPNNTRMTPTA